jgi:SAM-dependent methyltransferase
MPRLKATRIAEEFDAIADSLAADPRLDVLSPAERELLEHLPGQVRSGVDVGCGDGALTRAATARGGAFLGIDVSPRMVALAHRRTPSGIAARFRVADVMVDPFPEAPFDVVLAVNVVHHLALDEIVPRLASLVAPGGVLLIQDVLERPGLRHLPVNVVASAHRLLRPSRVSRAVSRLYASHGRDERYLVPSELDDAYAPLLPNARIRQHLEWRYSVIWHKPRIGQP